MGKRDKLNWDIPSDFRVALVLIGGSFFIGGILGCILGAFLDEAASGEISDFLTQYLALVSQEGVSPEFWSVVWEQLRFPLAAFLLGFTALGVVGLPILFGVRGFLFTFSIGCFCRLLGYGGLLPALFLFALPAFLWAPALFIIGVHSFMGAGALFQRTFRDHRYPLPYTSSYFIRCGLGALLLCLCIMLVYCVVPSLLSAAARAVL